MTTVNWTQLSAQATERALRDDGAIYLDVRTEKEFNLGHVEGAYNVPWLIGGQPNPAFLDVLARVWPRDQYVIVGCRTGNRSAQACTAMQAAGWSRVAEQHGGWDGKRDAFGQVLEPGWQAAGLPTATQPQSGRSYGELAARGSKQP